jgi:DNA-binding beta-propeller fold protein YncE
MKAALRICFCLALLAGGAALPGCGEDSMTAPRSDRPLTLVSDEVFVVGARAGLTLVGDADSVLVFEMETGVPEILPGAVIVGTDGGGYIRRVQSVQTGGKRLYVRAAPAFLGDAVIVGGIDTTVTLGFASSARRARAQDRGAPGDLLEAVPGASFSGGGIDLSNIILYSGDAGGAAFTVTITQGRIEFEPAIGLFARMGPRGLRGFRAIAEGDLNLACDVKFETAGSVNADIEFSAPIATLRKTFIQHIGPVPVVEVVTMSFIAGFTVTSGFTGVSEVGIETAGPVQCGLAYDQRAWSGFLNASPEFEPRPFYYDSRREARIGFSVRPSITVDFYGLRSAALSFGPSWGLSELEKGFPIFEWELWAAMRGVTSFDRGAIDARARTYAGAPSCCETTLDWGPFRTDSYVFMTQWGKEGAPGDGYLSYPKGVAVDGGGDVYVTDNWNNDVQKFTADGSFLLRWGGTGSGDGQFNAPEKIAVDEDGYVYVVDGGNSRVQKFAADGAFIAEWGSEGTGDGQLRSPAGIAARGGVVYVADGGNHRVQKFSTNGDFLGAWGTYGAGPGQFNGPTGVAVIPATGEVLVADCRNSRIQRFSPDGAHLASWGSYGTGDDQFDCPADVAAVSGGAIFVADLGNDRFVQLAPDGSFVTTLGTPGAGEGQFDHPEAIAVDGTGNVYVVDSRNRRVQKFAPRIALRSSSGVVTGLIPN